MAQWNAKWIGYTYDPQDLGVFVFRRVLRLDAAPTELPVKVSADNRYKLYANSVMVAFGPQRGDERHWFYDHFDLAPYLREGENEIVALVWNFGWLAPMAQHTVRTGFVFDGQGLDTPGEWEVGRVEGWGFEMMHSTVGQFYIDIGPGEIIGSRAVENVSDWRKPHVISAAEERGANSGGTPWMLIPRTLPPMRYQLRTRRPLFRRGFLGDSPQILVDDPDFGPMGIEDGREADELLVIPGRPILLDYGELLCAFPRLVAHCVQGDTEAHVTLTYAEAMWQPDGAKGNRNDVTDKDMRGYQDRLVVQPKGSGYEPLWWRTYRYLMIESDHPVAIRAIDAIETGYPIRVESRFEADDPAVKPIWDVSVRTAERCAGETYFDCPYYEQLQYVGDTRIQALIGYYLGTDRRLQRNAIETLGWSMMENGLTQSRYPSRQTQVIPPFSLWWIMMLYDQMLYDSERSFGFQSASMCSDIIEGFQHSMLDKTFWQFCDWVPEWPGGVPSGGGRTMNWCLVETARLAKIRKLGRALFSVGDDIALQMGENDSEEEDDHLDHFREGLDEDFELEDGLVRHFTDEEWTPSEHTEALFRQYQHMLRMEPSPWPYAALERANAAKCTYYFSYYKHLAMQPDDYMAQLGPWTEMIENGLTTFAENPEPTRSDCHAWSAHPILGFFQLVAGVTSVAPGWSKARIAPKPGSLKRFDALIAHPRGELRVAFEDGRLEIDTPVPADLVWKGKTQRLAPGAIRIDGS